MVGAIPAALALLLLAGGGRPVRHGVETGFGKPDYNPNKMICVSRDAVGSRLQSVRECHTAQQWEDQKMQEMVGLNRQQFNGDKGCNTGCPGLPPRDTPW